jgi:iron complex transport system ATP-binding protein
MLLDEPLNNLDMRHAVAMMRILGTVTSALGKRIVLVLHDINDAPVYSDQGAPAEVTSETMPAVYGLEVNIHQIDGQLISISYDQE